jgi:hypothetical protein
MGSSTLQITNHLNKSSDVTNEWHVLENGVLFARHNVLSSHGGLSHFTAQNLFNNIYYFFTPNLVYNVPM